MKKVKVSNSQFIDLKSLPDKDIIHKFRSHLFPYFRLKRIVFNEHSVICVDKTIYINSKFQDLTTKFYI